MQTLKIKTILHLRFPDWHWLMWCVFTLPSSCQYVGKRDQHAGTPLTMPLILKGSSSGPLSICRAVELKLRTWMQSSMLSAETKLSPMVFRGMKCMNQKQPFCPKASQEQECCKSLWTQLCSQSVQWNLAVEWVMHKQWLLPSLSPQIQIVETCPSSNSSCSYQQCGSIGPTSGSPTGGFCWCWLLSSLSKRLVMTVGKHVWEWKGRYKGSKNLLLFGLSLFSPLQKACHVQIDHESSI